MPNIQPLPTDIEAGTTQMPDAFFNLYNRTKNNAMLIMNRNGIVLHLNPAFVYHFGYHVETLVGHSADILFTKKDRKNNLPGRELETVLEKGRASDENFLVHHNGSNIWVKGESILLSKDHEEPVIVKMIHDINTQRVYESMFNETNKYIEQIFESVQDTVLIVTDMEMNILRTNPSFRQFFPLPFKDMQNKQLSMVPHPFWQISKLQQQLLSAFQSKDFNTSANYDYYAS